MRNLSDYIVESYDKNEGIKKLKEIVDQETAKENVKVISDIWKKMELDYMSYCKITGAKKLEKSYRWMIDRHYEGYRYCFTADDRSCPVELRYPESHANWDILIDRKQGSLYANYIINELEKLGCTIEEGTHDFVFVNIK